MENPKRLDAIDGKILKILLKESRTSFTEIAKTCKISVCAIRMRFNRLKSAGIITGEKMHVNPKFWGYEHIADLRMEASLNDEEKVLEMLKNKQYVSGATRFGSYIMCYVALSKLDNLRNIVEEIGSSPKVRNVNTLIWTKPYNIFHPENLIIKPSTDLVEKQEEVETSPAQPQETRVDEIDKQIVRILTQDARTPFKTVAKRLDISTNNVIQRYKKLREGKVLTLSTIMVDLHKLGYNAIHINFLKLETTSKMSEIRKQILQLPNMTMLIEHVGAYDLRVEFPVTDIEDIFRTTEQIRKIEGIVKADTIIKRIEPSQFPTPLYDKIVFNMGPPLS